MSKRPNPKKNGKIVYCKECRKEIYLVPGREKHGRGKYCSKKCEGIGLSKIRGKNNPCYKGDEYTFISVNKREKNRKQVGRIYARDTDGKLKLEHRILMERFLGRKLKKEEFIHHINCDSLDNKIENLFICSNRIHTKIHQRMGEEYAKMVGLVGCRDLINKILKENA